MSKNRIQTEIVNDLGEQTTGATQEIVNQAATAGVQIDTTVEPQTTWDIKQLGDYVNVIGKRTIQDMWKLGRALNFGKALLKHGKFLEWRKQVLPQFSASTLNRYMRLAKQDLNSANENSIESSPRIKNESKKVQSYKKIVKILEDLKKNATAKQKQQLTEAIKILQDLAPKSVQVAK